MCAAVTQERPEGVVSHVHAIFCLMFDDVVAPLPVCCPLLLLRNSNVNRGTVMSKLKLS